jgi:hypothetical protein
MNKRIKIPTHLHTSITHSIASPIIQHPCTILLLPLIYEIRFYFDLIPPTCITLKLIYIICNIKHSCILKFSHDVNLMKKYMYIRDFNLYSSIVLHKTNIIYNIHTLNFNTNLNISKIANYNEFTTSNIKQNPIKQIISSVQKPFIYNFIKNLIVKPAPIIKETSSLLEELTLNIIKKLNKFREMYVNLKTKNKNPNNDKSFIKIYKELQLQVPNRFKQELILLK